MSKLTEAGYAMLNIIASWVPGRTSASTKAIQFPVGAGFYAMKQNISQAGIKYFNLVVGDKSKAVQRSTMYPGVTMPSRGSRRDRPSTRRARRNVPVAA